MAINAVTLAVAKKYTADSMAGAGAVKGVPCQIKSIEEIEGGNQVTFKWVDNSNVEHTSAMNVMDGEKGDTGLGIKSVSIQTIDDKKHLIVTYDDDSTEDAGVLPSGGGGGGSSELEASLTTSVAVGGISSGKTYEAGTSLETLFRDMLNPTAYPTLTNPSATLTATGSKLLETGSTLNTTMTVAFSRGSINPAYGTSGYRSGAATGYSLNGGASQSGNSFNVTVTSALLSYRAAVSYEAGEQPKDSVGNNYSTPLAAGSVNSNTITYEFVDAIWANASAITQIAKLSLVSKSAKQKDFNFPAQTVANPEVFDIPASWTVTAVQVKNDLSGAWEDASSQFTVTDTTHDDASGTAVAYKRYTFNLGYDTGARSVRVKWS